MKIAVTGATENFLYPIANGLFEKLPPQNLIAVMRNGQKLLD
jgi:hypothetical protein